MSNLETEGRFRKLKSTAAFAKFVSTALAVALAILTFTGCAETSQLLAGTGINAPVVIKYTVSNPIECEEVREGNGTEFDYYYIRVSGLKDKDVEKKVNDRIKAVYDGLRVQDIPPYRGIKAKIPEGYVLRSESIYADVAGNFNNILSIMFNKYSTYQDPDSLGYEKDPKYYDSTRYYSEAETLNFDLNTGEVIKLQDVFCDNVDHMELVNDCMSRLLNKSYAEDEGYYSGAFSVLKQVESFKGLSEDQVFALYPYGIAFIFDYRTPQFETSGMMVSSILNYSEFGDNIALTERFYNDENNIYTSEEPLVKAFAMNFTQNDIVGSNYTREGPVTVYQSWGYSSTLPEEIKDRLEEMRNVDRAKVDELKEICSKLPPGTEDNPNNWGSYEIMVFGEQIGPFYNVSKNTNVYLPDTGILTSEYHCFDETLKELKIEDIFKKDIDYRPVLDQAIRKAFKDFGYAGPKGNVELSEDYFVNALNGIDGFNLQYDVLVISVESPADPNRFGSMNLYIPYKDIGCENLNIFD